MSNEIPLQVIYSRVDESSGIPLVSQIDQSSSSEVPKKSSYKTPCCAKVCMCLWGLVVFSFFAITIFSLFSAYFQMKGCFHSKNYELTEFFTEASSVKQIDFEVVTGAVMISTHDDESLVVKMYRSARETDYLEDIETKAELLDGVLKITSFSPAFEWSSCQFSYIEILFPADFTQNQVEAISVSGTVRAGFIEMGFLENLKDVDLSVEFGSIEVGVINANSLEVQGGFAYIDAEVIFAVEHAKFAVETGYIETDTVMAPNYEANVKYGSTRSRDIAADTVSVSAKYGYSTLLRAAHLTPNTNQVVSVDVYYGKAIATNDLLYPVSFEVAGERGDIGMFFEEECALDEATSTDDLLVGSCQGNESLQSTSTFKVSAKYGKALFIQNEADEDMLESYPEVLSGTVQFAELEDNLDNYEFDNDEKEGVEKMD